MNWVLLGIFLLNLYTHLENYTLYTCITVFGSARFKEDHEYYIAAREFGKRIAALGFTTMTGGG
jgi:predicted Rossmann-fold nucleotide-binding protein